ncbi:hypothetical protein [Pseudomonas inefficax]|uniref:hypothetical protein n=1 Tax=Pseudomonas inefficax TaxID=2078786 RepID=UPI004046E602
MSNYHWLLVYFLSRALVSSSWVVLVMAFGLAHAFVAHFLILFYLAWDAAINLLDAFHSGVLSYTSAQMINFFVSVIVSMVMVIAFNIDKEAVLLVWGVWAVASGLLHGVANGQRSSPNGVKWIMTLNGAQSVIAGVYFIFLPYAAGPVAVVTLIPYIALGALSFFACTVWIWLAIRQRRQAIGTLDSTNC